jgi:signal transduction histidine kinase
MSPLLDSVVPGHDWHLVVAAGAIGMIGSLAALSLLARAAAVQGGRRLIWVAATAAVAGSGVPVAYFMATLAFQPDLPTASEPWVTALSVVVAAFLVGGAFLLGLVGRRQPRTAYLALPPPAETASLRHTLSELEAKAADLTSALEVADAGDRAKSQFLATMSHELRTQLNAIIGFAEFLGSDLCGSLTPKQRGYVGDIHRAGGHLLQLVNDVHDLARIDARQLVLADDVVDLSALIANTIATASPHAAEVGIALNSVIAAGLPRARADARRLGQVLHNLLANAVKFTPRGGTITISAERRGAGIALIVADTGVGMTTDAAARSSQDDSQFARPQAGGLGLPLVKRLVELHGGTLAIDSAPGRGTTVAVLLPADRVVDRSKAA